MKLIARHNYFQRRQWQYAQAEHAAHAADTALPLDFVAKEKADELISRARERCAGMRAVPDYAGRLVFHCAAKWAAAVARQYEMDVEIAGDGRIGSICFITDEILSDRAWRDGRRKRLLLRLIRLAENVYITTFERNGAQLLSIDLSYCLVKYRESAKTK